MFEEVFRRKDTKILQKIAISKSAFRTVFTNINNFTLYFAIYHLTKIAIFASPFFTPKIEMHEKNQGRISELLNYECATKEGCNQYFFENKSS